MQMEIGKYHLLNTILCLFAGGNPEKMMMQERGLVSRGELKQ
jgi:hypothetical protein